MCSIMKKYLKNIRLLVAVIIMLVPTSVVAR